MSRSCSSLAAVTALVALALLGAGCSSHTSASEGGGVSSAPMVDPTTQPLPSNIPPAQQAQIRQQQAAAYAQAKAQQQQAPAQKP